MSKQTILASAANITTNYLPRYNGTGYVDSVIYDNGTNVGLGTISPNIGGYGANSRLLTIQGVSGSYGILELTSNSANADGSAIGRLDFGSDGQAANYKAIASIASFLSGSTSTKFGADLRFYTRANNAASGDPTERMRINSTGQVGIGTSSFTGFNSTDLVLRVQQSSGISAVQAISGDSGAGVWLYSGANSSDFPSVIFKRDLRFGSATDLGTGGYTERMRITSSGNVGIGTSSPQRTFDARGAVNLSTTAPSVASTSGAYADLHLRTWSGATSSPARITVVDNWMDYVATFTDGHRFRNYSSDGVLRDLVTISGGGDVGIGATGSAGNRFFVRGSSTSSGDTTIFAQNSAGTNLFYVRNNGTFYTGTAAESPYNLTIASSANVFVFSDGALFRATSSARYKKDIEDINVDTFGLINKIRPVWYRSTTGNDRDDWSWYGFIAEELAEVDPRFVHFGYAPEDYIKNEETGKTELKEGAELRADGVMYDRLTVLLIKGMQEQKKLIDELNTKVTDQQEQINQLINK